MPPDRTDVPGADRSNFRSRAVAVQPDVEREPITERDAPIVSGAGLNESAPGRSIVKTLRGVPGRDGTLRPGRAQAVDPSGSFVGPARLPPPPCQRLPVAARSPVVVPAFLESLLTFLFKYSPRVFSRGELVWSPVVPPVAVAALAVGAIGMVAWLYARLGGVSRGDRIVLGALRALALLLVLAMLLRPSLVVASAVPQRNVLAVLFDDSRSQRIADVEGSTRQAAVQRVFADSGALLASLRERFAVRTVRFAAEPRPLDSVSALSASGTRTDLARALDATREELTGVPLAGVIVVSDGADNSTSDLDAALLGLRARKVPVYTVGVGQPRFERDVAVERVTASSQVLAGGTVLVDASVRLRGTGNDPVVVTAEANGRVVAADTVRAPKSGDVLGVRLRVPPMPAGTYRLTVRASALPNELVPENNVAHTVLEVRAGPDRVLYVEGEPRPEFAFLRRAIAADSGVQLVALLRSAQGKFLRLGVRDSLELLTGFPTSREELFSYRAIVLGSIEASFFTGDQLRMLADFVNVRGGGLIALGGRSALAEGGYRGTPVADVLPLALDRAPLDTAGPAVPYTLRPTSAGLAHPALQLGDTDAASAAKWRTMPPLTGVNALGSLRPGASALLTGRRDSSGGSEQPLLAWHRYGRGVGAVFGVQDTWLWRMHADVAVDDLTHLVLWRQLLRWLVEGAPERIAVSASPDRVGTTEPITVRAQVADGGYLDVNDATVSTLITAPSGVTSNVTLDWSVRADGAYTGRFVPTETGVHTFSTQVVRGRDTTLATTGTLLVDDADADVTQAEMREAVLRRIANETGGRYVPLSDASRLLDDVQYTDAGVVVREARDLWDMPAIFLLLAFALGAEWIWRRWRGLV